MGFAEAMIGVGAATGIASAAFGGGGGGGGGGRLKFSTLEQELQFINSMQQDAQRLEQEFYKASAARDAYASKIEILDKAAAGQMMDEEVTKALTAQNAQIAMAMGGQAEELVKNGFLSQSEVDMLRQDVSIDPRVENQLKDERARLEQELSRAGVGPAERAQALAQFDQQAGERRFSSNIQMAQFQSGQRMQNFNLAQQTLAANTGLLDRDLGIIQGRAQGAASVMNANMAIGDFAGRMGEANRAAQTLQGSTDLSGRAQRAIDKGLTDVQTAREQTGGYSSYNLRSEGSYDIRERQLTQGISEDEAKEQYRQETLDKMRKDPLGYL